MICRRRGNQVDDRERGVGVGADCRRDAGRHPGDAPLDCARERAVIGERGAEQLVDGRTRAERTRQRRGGQAEQAAYRGLLEADGGADRRAGETAGRVDVPQLVGDHAAGRERPELCEKRGEQVGGEAGGRVVTRQGAELRLADKGTTGREHTRRAKLNAKAGAGRRRVGAGDRSGVTVARRGGHGEAGKAGDRRDGGRVREQSRDVDRGQVLVATHEKLLPGGVVRRAEFRLERDREGERVPPCNLRLGQTLEGAGETLQLVADESLRRGAGLDGYSVVAEVGAAPVVRCDDAAQLAAGSRREQSDVFHGLGVLWPAHRAGRMVSPARLAATCPVRSRWRRLTQF